MNKQELIEGIEAVPAHNTRTRPWIDKRVVLDLIRLLDEPQKVVVPQFVADWIEECKNSLIFNLKSAMNLNTIMNYSKDNHKIIDWIKVNSNQETFARAWLTDYEAEKEPKYKVKLKNTDDYLNQTETGFHFFNNGKNNEKFTRKELEYSGFGEVFNSPLFEVEEVE